MVTPTLRRSFIAFHLTLGLTLLVLSVRTAIEALAAHASHASPHVAALGILEGVGAALFLWPRTVRVGGVVLLLSIGLALLAHAAAGQFRGDLLVYAAGTWFVMVHGAAWGVAPHVAA
jgi:hypothetical protein